MKKYILLLASLFMISAISPVSARQIGQSANLNSLIKTVVEYEYNDVTFLLSPLSDGYSNEDVAFDFLANGSVVTLEDEYATFWLFGVTNTSDEEYTVGEVLNFDNILYIEEDGVATEEYFYYAPVVFYSDLSFEYLDYEDASEIENTILEPGDTAQFMYYAYLEEIPKDGRVFLEIYGDVIVEGFPLPSQ